MAKTFKIATAPTFKSMVSIPRVGGDPIDVQFTFKALNRKELATLFTKWKAEHDELIEGAADFTLEDWADKEIDMQVSQLKDIVVGWGFDDAFNDENIEELVNTVISVTAAITDVYSDAYNKARSGN